MLRLYARLRGVGPANREQAIEQLLMRIGLQQYSDRWDQLPGMQNELWMGLCIQWLMQDCLRCPLGMLISSSPAVVLPQQMQVGRLSCTLSGCHATLRGP